MVIMPPRIVIDDAQDLSSMVVNESKYNSGLFLPGPFPEKLVELQIILNSLGIDPDVKLAYRIRSYTLVNTFQIPEFIRDRNRYLLHNEQGEPLAFIKFDRLGRFSEVFGGELPMEIMNQINFARSERSPSGVFEMCYVNAPIIDTFGIGLISSREGPEFVVKLNSENNKYSFIHAKSLIVQQIERNGLRRLPPNEDGIRSN